MNIKSAEEKERGKLYRENGNFLLNNTRVYGVSKEKIQHNCRVN